MNAPAPTGEVPAQPPGFADLYYRRPRLLILTLCLILVSGLAALQLLPRAEDPVLQGRVARVVTRFPGASPERVEALVTEKLEEELLEISEFRLVRSTSRAGVSIVVLEIADAETEFQRIWTEAREAVDDAQARFPPGVLEPEFKEMKIAAFTLIAGLSWDAPGEPPRGDLKRLAHELRDLLRGLPGTEEVEIFGAAREEIRVEVDAATLGSLGRSTEDLARAVQQMDAKVSAGQLRGGESDLLVEVQGELDSLAQLRAVPVRQAADGRVVRLGDIARIAKTVADPPDQLALLGGKPGIAVAARMAGGVRVDRWTAQARERLEAFRADLPREIGLPIVFDQSRYTEERLAGLAQNLFLGVVLVMLVMLVMMGWRSALLVGVALPLSSLMVLSGMRILEIPLHQMSVTGLIIALGLLIDNAIVMVDAVQARIKLGLSPQGAIASSVRLLAVPLLSSTLTTALAFAPMVLMPGPAGEFVGAIAISVILALFSSLFLALTVIPALAGLLRRGQTQPRSGWSQTGLAHPGLTQGYRRTLDWFLARPLLCLVLATLLPVLGFVGGSQLREQFFPPSDRDQFQLELRLPQQASLRATLAAVEQARARLLTRDDVAEVHWFVGNAGPKFYYNMLGGQDGAAYFALALVQLERGVFAKDVIDAVQDDLDRALPQAQSVAKLLEQGPPFEAPITVHIAGPDLDELRRLGEEARRVLSRVPAVVQTRATLLGGRPKLWLNVDDEEARLAGLENVSLARQLDAALDGAVGGSILEGTEELPVRIRVGDARTRVGQLESLDLMRPVLPGTRQARETIPVAALGRLQLEPQEGAIKRRHGQRTNSVQGFLRAGVLPSRVLGEFREALAAEGFTLPPGYELEVGGESQQRDRAVGNLLASVGVLLVLMAATLVLSFNSFRQAAVIGAVGFLAVGLSLGALWLFGHPFGFMAIVGTMGLIGVAINDGIVVLAAIRDDPRASQGEPEAVREVVVHATRHVLATTVTTIAGFAPLLIAGSDFWSPLATAIAGGVAGATLLALYFVPSAFLLLMRLGMSCPLRQRSSGMSELSQQLESSGQLERPPALAGV